MNGLTALDLLKALFDLDKKGVDLEKVKVILGDDEELNGIHSAFFVEDYDMSKNNEDTKYLRDMMSFCFGHIVKGDDKDIYLMIS